MKYGVLYFSYANLFSNGVAERDRHISVNLGDYMQSLAIRNLYRKMEIAAADIVEIDRDTLASYDGEPAVLVMNGCFFRWSFPISQKIVPVFIGFQAEEAIVGEFRDYFRKHAPIGCRDETTRRHFEAHGIEAYVTGCLTLGFDRRTQEPKTRRIIVSYGIGAGAMPGDALFFVQQDVLADVEFVFQRRIFAKFPLSDDEMRSAEDYARYLLGYYIRYASMMVTPLHHAAAPSMACGIPVVICRKKADSRFTYLEKIIPVHIAPDFAAVNWNPAPIDMDAVRKTLIGGAAVAVRKAVDSLK